MDKVTIWKEGEEYHVVKASAPDKELVYPLHTAKRFYLEVVKAAVEGDEAPKEG